MLGLNYLLLPCTKVRATPGDSRASGHVELVHIVNLRLPSGLLKLERAHRHRSSLKIDRKLA